MTCTLRAAGYNFAVDSFLRDSPFQPATVYERGLPGVRGKTHPSSSPSSGFSVLVSAAGPGDIRGQVRDAIAFLDQREQELRRLSRFPGVGDVFLDFTVRRQGGTSDVALPKSLTSRASALGVVVLVGYLAEGSKDAARTVERADAVDEVRDDEPPAPPSPLIRVVIGTPGPGLRNEELIPDWSRLISLPPWTPLSHLGSPIVSFSDRLHQVGTNAFLLTATHSDDSPYRPFAGGPRIVLVHWAPSRGAAERIFARPETDDGACGTPPAELIPAGAVPQYGSIFAVLRSSGVIGLKAGSYRFREHGKVVYRFIGTHRVSFYFRGLSDDNSEPPFGISVLLFRPVDVPPGFWEHGQDFIRRMIDTWNRGDAEGFASMFAPYAEYVTCQGQRIWGREGIAEMVRQAGPGSQVVVRGPSVACDENAGKARFDWATTDQGTAARRGVVTCTLIRKETGWMVEALRNDEQRHRE